jgi:hypothetical protein
MQDIGPEQQAIARAVAPTLDWLNSTRFSIASYCLDRTNQTAALLQYWHKTGPGLKGYESFLMLMDVERTEVN